MLCECARKCGLSRAFIWKHDVDSTAWDVRLRRARQPQQERQRIKSHHAAEQQGSAKPNRNEGHTKRTEHMDWTDMWQTHVTTRDKQGWHEFDWPVCEMMNVSWMVWTTQLKHINHPPAQNTCMIKLLKMTKYKLSKTQQFDRQVLLQPTHPTREQTTTVL